MALSRYGGGVNGHHMQLHVALSSGNLITSTRSGEAATPGRWHLSREEADVIDVSTTLRSASCFRLDGRPTTPGRRLPSRPAPGTSDDRRPPVHRRPRERSTSMSAKKIRRSATVPGRWSP
ncbi:hypothetical protein GCM10010210_34760 [Pseudonocardia hydrocarbonoxydans]